MITESFDFLKDQVSLFKLELLKREENESTPSYLFGVLEKASVFIIITIVVYGGIYKLWLYAEASKHYGIDPESHRLVAVNPVIRFYKERFAEHPFQTSILTIVVPIILVGSVFLVARASIYVRKFISKLKIFSLLGLYTAISGAFWGTFYNKSEGVLDYLIFMAYQFFGK